jgi:hypothetical protein
MVVQTVVEIPAFLGDARALGLSDGERLAIVNMDCGQPGGGRRGGRNRRCTKGQV